MDASNSTDSLFLFKTVRAWQTFLHTQEENAKDSQTSAYEQN